MLVKITDRIADTRAALEAREDLSAWDRGVTAYALDLVETLAERADYEGHAPALQELHNWLLNGASNWSEYSWGGSSLIYNCDIAARLCCPSELKKTRNGERRPNSREEWLDTQARALHQAERLISDLYFRACWRCLHPHIVPDARKEG